MSKPRIEHWVKFFYPGTLFAETSSEPVESRDPEAVELPDGAYAFRFFDKRIYTIHDDETGETLEHTKVVNESGDYYPGGEVFTVDDVRALAGDHGILISNMKGNGWDRVVRSRRGNFQPMNEKTVLL